MEETKFETALKIWMVENGYINKGWRFSIESKSAIGNSDLAEVICKAYEPRKRKPFYITFKYNFVREQIKTDTIQVN
jgi:hypothetical protein